MSDPVLIGLDAGTSVIKAVAFEAGGRQIAAASRPNSYTTLPDGGVEQDMHRTWRDVVAVLQDLLAGTPNLAGRTAALAVTGQGDGCWLIDADGEPVHDGWIWLDARAATTARALDAAEGAETIYRTTGTGVNVRPAFVRISASNGLAEHTKCIPGASSRSANRSAIANDGYRCPPVPPPAKTIVPCADLFALIRSPESSPR